jgi:hypothetical protein
MLGNDEKVWVYLNSEDTWKKFTSMAVTEGFHFGGLPVERWTFGYVVAVHSNGDMGHLPLLIWCRSFSAYVDNCPQKVDFRRFINNHDDWFCETPHFTSIIR